MRIKTGLADVNFRLGPIHDYYVVFWRQPLIRDADRAAGATQDQIMWAASEHCVSDAEDVREVIEWADEEARRRSAIYTLYGVTSIGVEEGLVWLAGADPTRGVRGPNFERRLPADVDPVSGTPAEVYRPENAS